MDITTDDPVTVASGGGDNGDDDTDISWPGLASILAFYIIILVVGACGSFCAKAWKGTSEDLMLAGRNVGLVVGIFTMTATWVGGGYINGTAEYVATPGYGLVWCQAPFGYAISIALGGLFYAKKMHDGKYVTMLDPFHERYGPVMTSVLYIPALMGDVFYSASILTALGASLTVVVGLDADVAIAISAVVAVLYTLIGGLYSVALTDVIQLCCIFVGLWLVVPFALMHDAVSSISDTAESDSSLNQTGWLGSLEWNSTIGFYVDTGLLLICGGIPWQVYYQRVLSQRTARRAQILSFVSALGCFLGALAPILIGGVYASTDWSKTDYNGPTDNYALAVPLVMRYLTPTAVGVIGLGAISAAVMSSADSNILAASSMFAWNVYQPLRNRIARSCGRKKATDTEILWVMRLAMIVIGAAACGMAIQVKSIYGLFLLCSDLVFVLIFPQLTCILYLNFTNTYGAATGFILGLFFRLAGGEPLVDWPTLIEYPWYDAEHDHQNFPFRTMSMLLSLFGIVIGSWVSKKLFENQTLPAKADIFQCFTEEEPESVGKDNLAYVGSDAEAKM